MGHGHGFVATVLSAIVIVAAFAVLLANSSAVKTVTGGINQSVTSVGQTFAGSAKKA